MSDKIDEDSHSPLKIGDVVLNDYASPGVNDLLIITGHKTRKSGPYSSTRYYKARCLLDGKLSPVESMFSKESNKLRKIGHVNYEGYIKSEMLSIVQSLKEREEE